MFDYHMHTTVSFDAKGTAEEMVAAAVKAGLKEICFTDHIDYEIGVEKQIMVFDTETYNAAYDHLVEPEGLKIRRGMEFGLKRYNQADLRRDLQRRHFDFVLGSVHFVDEVDIYWKPFWVDKTVEQAYLRYLEETLECVRVHDDYDVLGHLTYLGKCSANPEKVPILYGNYREVVDEIFRILVAKGKGIEINTSGLERCGAFLPDREYLRRFKELGGQIVTVGSDAHHANRVGQYCTEAVQTVQEIFGYVCTFEDRKPQFHAL